MDDDNLIYDGIVSTPPLYLTTARLHWNSVLSTSYAKYLVIDVKNFYLDNLMKIKEQDKISIKLIPQDIIDKYDLNNKQIYGYIYVRVKKWIYGLVQSGIIAHEALKPHLKPYGYALANIIQGLWTHQDRDINFTLVVDNFGIVYRDKKTQTISLQHPEINMR